MNKLTINQIFERMHKAIQIGSEQWVRDDFKEIYLKGTDIYTMKQLRMAIEILEISILMKNDLKIRSIYDYKEEKGYYKNSFKKKSN